jgi:hypothetical protein
LPGPEVKHGRHFGYIESIDLETPRRTVVFDLAYFLTGEEANQAAAEDGYPTPVDNDYYIAMTTPDCARCSYPPRSGFTSSTGDAPPGSSRRIHDASSSRCPRRLSARRVQGKVLALLAYDQRRSRGDDRGAVSALTAVD